MNYLEEYKKWCEGDIFDEETKKELLEIKDKPEEIEAVAAGLTARSLVSLLYVVVCVVQ